MLFFIQTGENFRHGHAKFWCLGHECHRLDPWAKNVFWKSVNASTTNFRARNVATDPRPNVHNVIWVLRLPASRVIIQGRISGLTTALGTRVVPRRGVVAESESTGSFGALENPPSHMNVMRNKLSLILKITFASSPKLWEKQTLGTTFQKITLV